ncbi:GH3 auxin-responsive promoter family protein [bacterium SCSIO 12643]|nr:GH3 auxin-responsive promoter family protein [bacterium SCSIO 12643]
MEILNSILVWAMKKRIHQIDLFIKYPVEVQNDWFNKLIQTSQNTEWGKKYGYSDIKSIQEFKNRVPIQDYNSLKPFIDRAKNGEQNVLWSGETKWFAKSSGTTNDKSKFIPVTPEALETCHYKGGKDLISLYIKYKPDSKMFTGRGLVLGGSSEINKTNPASYSGDLSSIIIDNLPIWAELHRTPSKKIALMSEWEEKLTKMAERTADQNITTLAGVPSWTLVLLNKVLEIKGAKTIREVWPNLETYTHGGVSFVPFKKQFDQIFDLPGLNYMETYSASEGFFGIQDLYGESFDGGLLLMLDYGVFYEFLPLDRLDDENPETLTLDEVEVGVHYALIISTNAGLWRYQIGDTIMFTHLYPFRIKVTGRTKQFMNVFGEELMVENAEQAIKIACDRTQASMTDFTACPIFMKDKDRGGHEWAIEFSKPPQSMEQFNEILDTALKSLNSDYEAKRYKDFVLQAPIIHKLPAGTFYNWMKGKGKLGGQNKVPRLSNTRKYMDDILAF